MAIRVVSAGTTLVKRITVGTPTRIGDPSIGTIVGQDDVNDNINLAEGSYLRWDSSQQLFVHKDFDSDARNLLSANNEIEYDNTTGVITHSTSGVVAGDYGSASLIPTISVNSFGHIDSIGEVAVAGVSTFAFDSASATLNIGTADGGSFNARIGLVAFDTNELAEGEDNLYYTDARVDDRLSSGSVSDISISGTLSGPSTFIITPAALDSDTGTLVIDGNLKVEGTTTTINSTTLSVNDKNIVLADSAVDSADANGAGITVDGANASIIYNFITDTWDLNKPLGSTRNHLINFSTTDLSEGTNLYYLTSRFDSDFNDNTTDQLTEGSSNLYYTTARADSDARHAISVSGDLTYDVDTGIISINVEDVYSKDNFDSDFNVALDEAALGGTGLIYDSTTNTLSIDSSEFTAMFTTDNLNEGSSNLYYTDARVNQAISNIVVTDTINVKDILFLDSNNTETSQIKDLYVEGKRTTLYTTEIDSNHRIGFFTNELVIENLVGQRQLRTYGDSGHIELYFADSHRLETNTYGIEIFGRLTADSATLTGNITADTLTGEYLGFDSDLARTSTINSIRSYFSANGDLSYDSSTGQFSFDVESVYTQANFDSDFNTSLDAAALGGTGLTYDSSTNTLSITDTGVVSGTYGSASLVPVLTVNARGQVDSIGTVSVAGVSSVSYDSASYVYTINTADGQSFPQMLHTRLAQTADTFGSASLVPIITVDEYGHIDSIGTTSVAGVSSTSFDSSSGIFTISTADGGVFNTTIRDDSTYTNLITRRSLSIVDAGGDGSFAYDSSTGQFTYTGPSASEVRSHFSAAGDLSYDSSTGQFSFDVESVYTQANFDSDFNTSLDDAALGGTGLTFDSSTNTLSITDTGVVAGTYGSASEVPVFTVNAQGQLDSAGTVSVAGVSSTAFDSDTGYYTISTADGGSFITHLYSDTLVNSSIDTRVTKSFVDALNVDADTFDTLNSTQFLRSDVADIKTSGNLTFNDNVNIKVGTDEDLSIYHNSDTYIKNDTGVLYIQGDTVSITNNAGTGTMGYFTSGDAARLYFNNGEKIRTKSDGVVVTGEVEVSTGITNTSGETFTTPTETLALSNSTFVVDTEPHNSEFKSIEYVVHMDDSANNHSQISKILVTYNKSSVFYSEYGMVNSYTGDSDMGTLTADVSGSDIRLIFQRTADIGTVSVKPVKTVIS